MKHNFCRLEIIVLACCLGLAGVAIGQTTTSDDTSTSTEEGALPKEKVMEGTWNIRTVGKIGAGTAPKEGLNGNFTLIFLPEPKDGNIIEGWVFGKIVVSNLFAATPGGKVKFQTSFTPDSSKQVQWSGTLSEDGKKITDGVFTLIPSGQGTFTAKKQ